MVIVVVVVVVLVVVVVVVVAAATAAAAVVVVVIICTQIVSYTFRLSSNNMWPNLVGGNQVRFVHSVAICMAISIAVRFDWLLRVAMIRLTVAICMAISIAVRFVRGSNTSPGTFGEDR